MNSQNFRNQLRELMLRSAIHQADQFLIVYFRFSFQKKNY